MALASIESACELGRLLLATLLLFMINFRVAVVVAD
jgi:hypothetical protein